MRPDFTRALQASPSGVVLRCVWEGPGSGAPRPPLPGAPRLHFTEGALTAHAPQLQGGAICALIVGCKRTGRRRIAPEPAYHRSETRQARPRPGWAKTIVTLRSHLGVVFQLMIP